MYETPVAVLSPQLIAPARTEEAEPSTPVGMIDIRSILLEAFEACGKIPAVHRYDSAVWGVVFTRMRYEEHLNGREMSWEKLFSRDGFNALAVAGTL